MRILFLITALCLLASPSTYAATFKGFQCTNDCSGHIAGYEWARQNGITNGSDCRGNSKSFIEGCIAFTGDYTIWTCQQYEVDLVRLEAAIKRRPGNRISMDARNKFFVQLNSDKEEYKAKKRYFRKMCGTNYYR